ncbi:MAG: hypothetical protein RL318_2398 [Fibrobacterota bacterium]|jgi:hypothetical protein
MTLVRNLAVSLACLVAFSQAARKNLPTIGVSVWVPDSWVEVQSSPTDFYWQDTSATGMRGLVGIAAYDSAAIQGTRNWTLLRTQALKTTIESDPMSILYAVDSIGQDGHFAMYINSVMVPDTLAIGMHDRFTAWGKTGYQLYAYSDTADFFPNYGFYTAMLDSMRLDNAFSGLGIQGRGARYSSAFSVRSRPDGSVDFKLTPRQGLEGTHEQNATVVVTDLRGRTVWTAPLGAASTTRWTPTALGPGTYLAKVSRNGTSLGTSTFLRLR